MLFSLPLNNSGADMISIHNKEENAFILDTLKKQWKAPDDILLGMFYDTDGKGYLPCEMQVFLSLMLVKFRAFQFFSSLHQIVVSCGSRYCIFSVQL